MKPEVIKKFLKSLKDSCIDNVDKHFNEYILMDYNDAFIYKPPNNQIDYLIDDVAWYDFWMEKEEEILGLQESIKEIAKREVRDQLFLDLIQIKRVVDKKLLKIKDKDTIYADLDLISKSPDIIDLNFSLENLELAINTFYEFLSKEKLISCTLKNFMQHFQKSNSDENIKLITWHGSIFQLVGIFSYARINNVIRGTRIKSVEKLISNHFVTNENESFNRNTIRTYSSQLQKQEKEYPETIQIIEKLKQIN